MKSWLVLFFFLLFPFASAQDSGFHLSSKKKLTLPFQLINNLIFIDVEVNGVTLTFLLDTGVAETLLISLEDKEVNFSSVEKIKFAGLGATMQVEGLKSQQNMVKITDQFIDDHHTIYIILDETFNFSSYVGIPVHGIIGYHFFKNHQVEIDYISKKLTVYNDENYFKRKTKKYREIPIMVVDGKPYAETILTNSTEKKSAKMLIDIGNSDAVWMFPAELGGFTTGSTSLEDFLGRGFNGDIFGERSRLSNISIGDFTLEQPITSIPDAISTVHLKTLNGRKGSIGSEVMRRFTVIFDYPEKKMLLKTNKNYNNPFRSNKSGLEFKHVGVSYEKQHVKLQSSTDEAITGATTVPLADYIYKLVLVPTFAIAAVRRDSPAAKAGIKKDDVLRTINGQLTSHLSLTELNEMMMGDEGKSFTFEIVRGGLPLKVTFILTDPIPYLKQ